MSSLKLWLVLFIIYCAHRSHEDVLGPRFLHFWKLLSDANAAYSWRWCECPISVLYSTSATEYLHVARATEELHLYFYLFLKHSNLPIASGCCTGQEQLQLTWLILSLYYQAMGRFCSETNNLCYNPPKDCHCPEIPGPLFHLKDQTS